MLFKSTGKVTPTATAMDPDAPRWPVPGGTYILHVTHEETKFSAKSGKPYTQFFGTIDGLPKEQRVFAPTMEPDTSGKNAEDAKKHQDAAVSSFNAFLYSVGVCKTPSEVARVWADGGVDISPPFDLYVACRKQQGSEYTELYIVTPAHWERLRSKDAEQKQKEKDARQEQEQQEGVASYNAGGAAADAGLFGGQVEYSGAGVGDDEDIPF